MNIDELQEVNYEYNRRITYVGDGKKYRVAEQWENATEHQNQGDCEDFAIAKLHALLERGWPIETLRLAFCWVGREADDSGHAVLLAECDNRLWVLDNRFNQLREVSDCTDYVWNTTQLVGGSTQWVACRQVFSQFYDSTLPPE
jgi:predicted transglutaminase-like cysteine proteinase